ncbi:hypothetical protein MUN74_12795 [Agromyces endophyticus]|uniref:hypothetical protein n=1 Tax=Agromyces sp. H17E-10 TaxID=2932244 RepID=UPI001FD0846F|nr:hypothetical protein [Agromyces sp. H17E-10]UOQ88163.1 hypothetical protein MUN74_12795 [Agromyces sp. H17E-10]
MEFVEPGVIWYAPNEFLSHFHPSDDCGFGGHQCPGAWHVLERVREDERYEAVKKSLQQHGWVRPLPWRWTVNPRKWGDLRVRELLDGHNRASAAVEMGLDLPLVEVITVDAIADDSGRWNPGDEIPPTTLTAMYKSSQIAHPHPWAESWPDAAGGQE